VQNLFFDLDGTLVDPRRGFVRCLAHALREVGAAVPGDETLATFIGPPLRQSLRELLSASADAKLARAVEAYDREYAARGVFENTVYPGVSAGLRSLADAGWTIRVLTSKRTDFARKVVEHFGLSDYVTEVAGFDASGSITDKGVLLRTVLKREAVAPGACWMIGDRSFDVVAARENAVRAIGVLWGYGSRRELEGAGAERVVATMAALVVGLGRPGPGLGRPGPGKDA
jgi:phosphoglycolate phosphatase